MFGPTVEIFVLFVSYGQGDVGTGRIGDVGVVCSEGGVGGWNGDVGLGMWMGILEFILGGGDVVFYTEGC